MGQTVNSDAGAPMGKSVIGSKDASVLQDAKGSSVRKKVKQGNTVVRAMFSTSESSSTGIILPPVAQDSQTSSVSIQKLRRLYPKS